MEEKDEIIISPKVIGEVLKKNAVFIVITVLLFSLCSLFVTKFFITKQYTSKVSLYVDTAGNDDSAYNSSAVLNQQTYAQRLVATYIRMLDTTKFYTAISENLQEKYTPTQLSRMIRFTSDEDTEIFDVYIVSESPTESKRIGDAVAEVAPETISGLKSNAQLKVCDPAQIPSAQSYPKTSKNVILAFIAGLTLSLLIAFIRHYADKKIKYNDEMTEIFDIPILAAIPNFDNYITQKKK